MSLLYLSTHVILKLHLIHKRSHFTIRAKQTLCTKRVYFISYQMYHLHLLLWFMIRALVAPPSGMNLLLVNLRLTYTPPTYLHLCFCLTCIQLKTKPTPNPQSPVPPPPLSLSRHQAVAPQLPQGSWWRCWGSRQNIVWTTVKHSSLQLPDQRQRITNSLL